MHQHGGTMHQHGGDMHQHGGLWQDNDDILDFSININLAGISERVREAASLGVLYSDRYPDTECKKLREEIAKWENVPMQNIICGNGAADLIFSVVMAQKPKKALLISPTFYEYEKALRAMDCEITYFSCEEENDFMISDSYIKHLTREYDIAFLCNPNNPTGTLSNQIFMDRVMKRCQEQKIVLVVDECFMDFVNGIDQVFMKKYLLEYQNLFILKAFTKQFAMPGLRLGYGLCSNQELLQKMAVVSQAWSVSTPAQMAGIAALNDTTYLECSLNETEEQKTFLLSELQKIGFKIYGYSANFIFFKADSICEKLDLAEFCIAKKIRIRDCSNFNGLKKGFYRIAVKRQEENEKLVSVLQEAVKWQK